MFDVNHSISITPIDGGFIVAVPHEKEIFTRDDIMAQLTAQAQPSNIDALLSALADNTPELKIARHVHYFATFAEALVWIGETFTEGVDIV